MASTNPARGMRDFLPADVRKRNYVINIIKEVYESYGFEPFETLSFETPELEANTATKAPLSFHFIETSR